MARRANLSDDGSDEHELHNNGRAERQAQRRVDLDSQSPSPSVSFSSDKENRSAAPTRHGKNKSMGPPQTPASERTTPLASRKRKLGEREIARNATQVAHREKLDNVGDTLYYNPEQDMDERRQVRKDYRDLSRELTGIRARFWRPYARHS